MFKKTKRVFLDYASSTPVDKTVVNSMLPFLRNNFENPSSLYIEGRANREIIDDCRKRIAKIVQSKPTEIIFTGSGTESDNLGIVGVARAIKKKIQQKLSESGDVVAAEKLKPHLITTKIEHVAVLESFRALEKQGFDVTYLSVNEHGLISEDDVKSAIRPETILISIMLANNEIGTILPLRKIGVTISAYKKQQNRIQTEYPYLHTDASQAPNYLDVNIDRLSVDLMTLDGTKIYGPRGIGCLIAKSYVPIENILYGGAHEFGLRPGTENLSVIVGFTVALEIAEKIRERESTRMFDLQKYFIEKIESEIINAKISEIKINGDLKNRLPNNVNICINGLNSEFAVIQLDEYGVCCAAMTACKNLSGEANSYVVSALSESDSGEGDRKKDSFVNCGKSSLRFTMGRGTTKKDVDFAVEKLKKIVI